MRPQQLLALAALCPPAFSFGLFGWLGCLGGCARVTHQVGEYNATQVATAGTGAQISAGSGSSNGQAGTGTTATASHDAGALVSGQRPADAAVNVPSTDGKCTWKVQSAQRHPLDMYILMDGNVTLTLGLWQLATRGLRDFANDPRSAGLSAGLRFYGTDCDWQAYDTRPTLDNGLLPGAAPAWDNALRNANSLQASEMLAALKGGIHHQANRVMIDAASKHIVVVITDGFAQDLPVCTTTYTPSDVAAMARAGLTQTPSIETHVIELDAFPPNTPLTNNPLANAFQGFDTIAADGGSGSVLHTDPTNVPGSVNEDLQAVRRKAQPCDFARPDQIDKDRVGVALLPSSGSGEIPRVGIAANCGGRDGWYYDDASQPTRIFICPATCSLLRTDDTHSISLLVGCAPKT
jgi:hypothetical protein